LTFIALPRIAVPLLAVNSHPAMLDSIKSKWAEFGLEHPQLYDAVESIRRNVPVNFITLHYTYFTLICLISSAIFYGSSKPAGGVSYVDSLYLVTSAMTSTGLNTRNLSEVTTWQQVLLWFLMLIGSPIWVSFWTVMVRKHAFERRFEDIVQADRERRKAQASGTSLTSGLRRAMTERFRPSQPNDVTLPGFPPREDTLVGTMNTDTSKDAGTLVNREASVPTAPTSANEDGASSVTKVSVPDQAIPTTDQNRIAFVEPTQRRTAANTSTPLDAISNYVRRHRSPSTSSSSSGESEDFLSHFKRILKEHNVGRNGQFFDLSSDEREKLGGCEYRALKILAFTVAMYFVLWQLFAAIALGAWMAVHRSDPASTDGANAWWTGIFYSISAFNNVGMSLIDDNMIPFQSSYFVLIIIGLLVLAGNTAYPIFLRLILWTSLQVLRRATPADAHKPLKETLEFILKYPRRVYTTLFPSRATWWLLAVLVITNVVDWLAFEIMNIGNPEMEVLPVGDRIMDGLFQAVGKSLPRQSPRDLLLC
jgi:uncharacterized protein (DUF983 family)